MKRLLINGLIAGAAVLCFSAPAFAQATVNGSVNINVNIAARAKLTLGAASLSFNDDDPDTAPSLSAGPLSIDVRTRSGASDSVTLTVLASGDFTAAGGATIGIGSLSWTAGGTGFSGGTANASTAQTVGAWTGSGAHNGSQTFALVNSWAYPTGNYSVTLNYTLTAP